MYNLTISDIAQMTRARAEAEIRARVQTVVLDDDWAMTRVLGNPKMFLSVRDGGFSPHVMLDGYFEIWLTLFLARTLKPGMHVVDVGGGYGYFSLLMAFGVNPGGRLLAIEPDAFLADQIERNLKLNGFSRFADVMRYLPGAADGDRHSQPASTGGHNQRNDHDRPADGAFSVETRRIDSLVAGWSKVDLVRLDLDVRATEILDGMAETIDAQRPDLVIRVNPARIPDVGSLFDRLGDAYGAPRRLDVDSNLIRADIGSLLAERHDGDVLLFYSDPK